MSLTQSAKDLAASAKAQYQALLRSLRRRKGFGILFIQCSPATATRLIARVKQDLPQKKIAVLQLDQSIDNLYEIIANRPDRSEINILFIQGIERSLEPYIQPGYGGQGDYYNLDTAPRILSHLNQQRENFRDRFSNICFVFIVPLFALKYFIQRAPDFFDWRSGVFEFPEILGQESSLIFGEDEQKPTTSIPQAQSQKNLEIQELLERGNQFFATESYEEALRSYDQALKIKPDKDSAWYNRGVALGKLGRYEEEIASYDQALKIKPDEDSAWYNRGNALGKLGRYEEAIASYDQALKIKPDKYEASYYKASCYAFLGKADLALENLQQAIALNPESVRERAKTDPAFDSLREDERFRALLATDA